MNSRSVSWSGTSVSSGRFDTRPSDSVVELFERLESLRAQGRGYLEIQVPGHADAVLTMGFRAEHAVIHLLDEQESVSLLKGDGSVPREQRVDVPIIDEDATFTGDFVSRIDRAAELVRRFLHTDRPEDLGQWCEL